MRNIKLSRLMNIIDINVNYVEIYLEEKAIFCNLPYSSNMLINHKNEIKMILKKYKNHKVSCIENEYDDSLGYPYMIIQLK